MIFPFMIISLSRSHWSLDMTLAAFHFIAHLVSSVIYHADRDKGKCDLRRKATEIGRVGRPDLLEIELTTHSYAAFHCILHWSLIVCLRPNIVSPGRRFFHPVLQIAHLVS